MTSREYDRSRCGVDRVAISSWPEWSYGESSRHDSTVNATEGKQRMDATRLTIGSSDDLARLRGKCSTVSPLTQSSRPRSFFACNAGRSSDSSTTCTLNVRDVDCPHCGHSICSRSHDHDLKHLDLPGYFRSTAIRTTPGSQGLAWPYNQAVALSNADRSTDVRSARWHISSYCWFSVCSS